MSPHFKSCRKIRKRKTHNSIFSICLAKIGWLNILLLIVLIGGIFLYLIQISKSTTKGFLISDLQIKSSAYQGEVSSAKQQINDLKSIEYIASEAEKLNMVAANEIDFLAPISSGVAISE